MTTSLLAGRGLCKTFGGNTVLRDADFRIEQGDFILLRGDNGSGKTTLLNILTGYLEADAGKIVYSGNRRNISFRFPRSGIDRLDPLDRFAPHALARLGFMRTWQDIRLFETQTVLENAQSSMPRNASTQAAHDILRRVGLSDCASQLASELSLGQAKRLSIARAIGGQVRVVFLDEPLSGLDKAGIQTIITILSELVRDLGVAIVIVEHALNYHHVAKFTNQTWLLDRGRIVVSREKEVLENAALEQRLKIIENVAREDATITDEQLSEGAHITRVRSNRFGASRVMLEVRKVQFEQGAFSTSSSGRVADKFDIKVHEGETVFLWAPNGWGKTTLCRGISGVLQVAAGEIFLNGTRVDRMPPWERTRKGLHTLPADYAGFPNLLVSEALVVSDFKPDSDVVASLASQRCGALSGGQLQKLALATSVPDTGVLVLDEPFARLDAVGVVQAMKLLEPAASRATLVFLPSS